TQLPFGWFSTPLVLGSRSKPPIQRVQISLENENPVKQVDKADEISGATAEEGDRVALISDQGFDFVNIPKVVLVPKPKVMLVPRAIQRFTGLWIALIGQLTVTVDGVETAPPQFVAD
ncbi:MAG: hypothetical protein AVDCRST_MAG86-4088, partial [uncultured Truepera sp.]